MKSRLNQTDRPWIALVLIFMGLAVAVSVTSPLFEASDEIRHYRYVRILATEYRLPVQGQESARAQSHHPPLFHTLAAVASAWVPTPHNGDYHHPENPFWGYQSHLPGVDNKLQYWHSPAEPFREGYFAALLPRWLNVTLGAATVYLTYRLAQRVLIDHLVMNKHQPQKVYHVNALALAAAAIVALNPQFIYISGAINNDIIAALAGTGMLLSCAVVVQKGINWQRAAALGLVSGLGLLSKLQIAALGPVVLLALTLAINKMHDQTRRLPHFIRTLAFVAAIVLLVSGWWFVRNQQLYGEPTGMRMLNEMWGGREVKENLWAIGQGLPQLWHSLWGQFGYGQIPLPGWMITTMALGCIVCLSGYFLYRQRAMLSNRMIGMLLTAIVCMLMVVAYYMASNPAGAMGRFLFPVLPAFAILLVAGLNALLAHPVWTQRLIIGGMGAFSALALFGFLWPAVTYPKRPTHQPTRTKTTAEPLARVGDVADILDIAISPDTVQPGATVFVSVTWRPLHWTDEPLVVFVHLVDDVGVVVAQRDTWPGLSRAPTTSWRAGVPFEDVYRIDLPATLYAPNQLTAHIGVYGNTVGRLPITVAGAAPTDSWPIGQLRVTSPEGQWSNPIEINFENQVQLIGYEITPRTLAAGETLTLTTVWQVLSPPASPQHIFAQVLDNEWHVWGSKDGGHPAWTTGIVTDTREITLIPETPPGSYPVNVGLVSDEGRLTILGANKRPIGDFISLGPIGVR